MGVGAGGLDMGLPAALLVYVGGAHTLSNNHQINTGHSNPLIIKSLYQKLPCGIGEIPPSHQIKVVAAIDCYWGTLPTRLLSIAPPHEVLIMQVLFIDYCN